MQRLLFLPKSDTKFERIGKLIHVDLSGSIQENSLGRTRYFLIIKNDYNHWRNLYFIKNKSEIYLEDFFKKTDKHLEKRIKIFRLDLNLSIKKLRN